MTIATKQKLSLTDAVYPFLVKKMSYNQLISTIDKNVTFQDIYTYLKDGGSIYYFFDTIDRGKNIQTIIHLIMRVIAKLECKTVRELSINLSKIKQKNKEDKYNAVYKNMIIKQWYCEIYPRRRKNALAFTDATFQDVYDGLLEGKTIPELLFVSEPTTRRAILDDVELHLARLFYPTEEEKKQFEEAVQRAQKERVRKQIVAGGVYTSGDTISLYSLQLTVLCEDKFEIAGKRNVLFLFAFSRAKKTGEHVLVTRIKKEDGYIWKISDGKTFSRKMFLLQQKFNKKDFAHWLLTPDGGQYKVAVA